MVERLAYGHLRDKAHVLGGHDRTGGILIKEKETVYHLSILFTGGLDDSLYYSGGHLLDDVNGIVEIHLLKNCRKLSVREAFYKSLLSLGIKLDKDVCRSLLTKKSKYYRVVFGLNLGEHLCDIYIGDFLKACLKLCIALAFDQLRYFSGLLLEVFLC